jgi:alpha-1,2-mannosyltransferase
MLPRYLLVSVGALAIDYAIYIGLLESKIDIGPAIAAAIGYFVGAIVHYWASRRFVFPSGWMHERQAAEFGLFLLTGVVGAAFTSGVIWSISKLFDAGVHLPKIIAVITSFLLVYGMRKLLVFRPPVGTSSPWHLGYLNIGIAFCVVVGLYDVVQFIALNMSDPSLGLQLRPTIKGPTIYPDFITPYAAAQAYFQGKLALIYNHAAFNEFRAAIPGLAHSSWFLYPPVWVMVFLPLGLLPVNIAGGLFMAINLLASAFESRRQLWSWVAIATSPAAVWAVLSGQSTFLYMALIYGGMRMAESQPIAAGLILGILVYKPHVCILIPLALLASRQWKALGWMIAMGSTLVLISVAVFGIEFWMAYIDMVRHLSDPGELDVWVPRRPIYMVSVFTSSRILLIPNDVCYVLQTTMMVLAASAVWWAFRRPAASEARMAVLVAATLLASPYVINYDLLLLLPAVVALYRRGAIKGFYVLEPVLYPLLWLAPTLVLWLPYTVVVAPVLVLALGIVALMRLQNSSWIKTNTATCGSPS